MFYFEPEGNKKQFQFLNLLLYDTNKNVHFFLTHKNCNILLNDQTIFGTFHTPIFGFMDFFSMDLYHFILLSMNVTWSFSIHIETMSMLVIVYCIPDVEYDGKNSYLTQQLSKYTNINRQNKPVSEWIGLTHLALIQNHSYSSHRWAPIDWLSIIFCYFLG